MPRFRLFISSVQSEFATQRKMLFEYIKGDPLLGLFFEPFIFENVTAQNESASTVFFKEVERSAIYLALLGVHYGYEDHEGISPTEREFDKATEFHKTRLVFISSHPDDQRQPKQLAFIMKAQSVIVRKRFEDDTVLLASVYAALVNFLITKEVIQTAPFDASLHPSATLDDIDSEKVVRFVQSARMKRGFPFLETADLSTILIHLNLMKDDRLTNAAILLFGKAPQRFFINSEIRCAHFYGTTVEKPIPSYQVFKGDVFELVDQAEGFVLSKLDYRVGTRDISTTAPGEYEIPKSIISEAIINAVAHRDYTENGSIQVMLFKDRLEIWNPGALPMGWTIEKLREPHSSIPYNPLLAQPMYLNGYIERMGTGTADMFRIAKEFGLKEPFFNQDDEFKAIIYRPTTDQVPTNLRPSTDQVPTNLPSVEDLVEEGINLSEDLRSIINVLHTELSRKEIQEALNLKHKGNFREKYLEPALEAGLIAMKYPEIPNHPQQRYLLTKKGRRIKEAQSDNL